MDRTGKGSHWTVLLLIVTLARQAMMVNGQADGDLRLTGFESSRLAGTVEIYFFGNWYTICNDFFTLREAAVVCRQLGLGYPVRIFNQDTDGPNKTTTNDSPVSRFGFGSGIIAMDDVNCTGEEPHILSCSYGSLAGAHNCAQWESVGVQCSDVYPQPYSGQVRLKGGEFPSSGRLEVYFSGQWGAVYGDGALDANLATTVCRQLGISSGTGQAVRYAQSVPVWLTSVSCSSSSTCLSSCLASAPTATQTCSSNTYISISCNHDALPVRDYGTKDRCEMTSSNPGEGSLRLVGGATNNTGVLQVYLSGTWIGICANGIQYDSESLDVACRQLGYRSWVSAGSANFAECLINIGRLTVDCNGGEQRITDCNITTAEHSSSCTMQFHLTCSTDWIVPLYGAVLLTGGGGASGTLAVDGIGSLCDSPFSLDTGDVACRQMGYEGARAVKNGSFYGSPAFEVGTSGVCSGCEQNLTACCLMSCSGSPATAAGVQCIVNSSDSDRGNLRLIGGNSTAGRLQMQLDGVWTQVCSNGFSAEAANVACSQLLGLGSTGTVHTDGRYGNTNTGTLVVQRCIGTEAKLYDCWYYSVDSRLCTSDVALECKQGECSLICENGGTRTTRCTCVCANGFTGMNCSTMMVNGQADGDLRLTGFESSRLAGRVEMIFFGQWYTICNDFFTLREAAVVCRQLGLGYPVRIFNQDTDGPNKTRTSDSPVSRFGFGSGIHAMDDVNCTGEEPHILSCSYGALGGAHNCAIYESVGVQCSDLYPQPYSGQVRLEGGEFSSSGRLEVYFSGQWGAVCGEGTLDANLPTTVCRQLGYSSGSGQAVRYAQSVPVWLTSVSCSSSTTCLSSCLASAPTANQTCLSNTYISISCAHNGISVRDYCTKDRCEMVSSNPGEGSLRLVGGATNNTGVLQVYLSGMWRGICANGIRYDSESLEVVCRQLGYRSWHSAGSATFTNSPINIGRLTVNCNGGEQQITDCDITAEELSALCTTQFHLTCSTDWNAPLYGAVLLTGGGGASGTLAVERIGSLCDSPFSPATGDVACRQMGYEGARAVKNGSFYGSPAFLVQTSGVCNGSEQNLTACHLMNCSGTPGAAAGVQCIVNISDSDRGNLRLVGGNSTAGWLQMQLDGVWTQVCSAGFSAGAANVACSQLLGLGSTGTVHTNGRYGNNNTGTLVVQRCIGTEAKLYDCWYYSVDSRLCTSDVALECKPGECSICCENGGTLTTDCTCDCADGFSGMNCNIIISCGQPDSPSNGHVNTSAGTSFGDVARYSCDTGYTLNGPAERTCQADGCWNGNAPSCLQCPPVCTHQYCSKRANRAKVCSLPGFGSCTGACKITSCRACHYNDSSREILSGCQRHQCNGLTERPLNKCLNKWGKCIRKQYMMLYSKDQDKQERLFKCFEYPC